MTQDLGAVEPWPIIELTQQPDIAFGSLLIRPSLGEIAIGGVAIRLERRVMQVLVALAEAKGEAVSRDELVARCWEGVPIGDEAIAWCIGRLKRLTDEEARGAFTIETLPGIGHRLNHGLGSRGAKSSKGPPIGSAGRGSAPSLAVLPFANRSGLPQDDVFAFGMVEDLIDAMSHGLALRVMSSSSLSRFRQHGVFDLEGMGRELGVKYLLQGEVGRVGDKLLVSARLEEVAGGAVLWTSTFERRQRDLAALQGELVLQVAAQLRTQAKQVVIEQVLRKPGNLTAWEAVMRSMAAARRVSGPSIVRAAEEARKAVEISPDYPLALAHLSSAQAVLYHSLIADDDLEVERIRAQAEKAIRLQPGSAGVLATAAGALTILGFPGQGLAAAQRAITINPYSDHAHLACGTACVLLDRVEDAIVYFDREQELAPGHPMTLVSMIWRATAYARAERWQEALDVYDRAVTLAPDEPAVLIGRGIICRRMGLEDEATSNVRQARQIDPATPLAHWELRFKRSYVRNPGRAILLAHLGALWAQTDPLVPVTDQVRLANNTLAPQIDRAGPPTRAANELRRSPP